MKRVLFFAPFALLSCSASHGGAGGVTVSMRFERASFYDAPFPSDDLVQSDGTIAIAGFPDLPPPDTIALVEDAKSLVASSARGFAEEGGIFFTLSDTLDPSPLPDAPTSVTPGATAYLVGVTPTAPDFLKRYPVTVRFEADGGPFGAPNMLTLVPLQGTPLRPKTTYAAVVTREAGVAPSAEMTAIAGGHRPDAMPQAAFAEYQGALGSLAQAGVDPGDVAGLAVFTTDDPTAQLGLVLADMLSRPLPVADTGFVQTDLFPTFCVYTATIPMPDYQAGDKPYDFASHGGGWVFDASGKPVMQRTEEAGFVVSIPRAPMPPGGWPIVHFIRTGGGGNRPLVDRGPQGTTGGPALVPGTGPALWFAKAGVAGASVDGPHEDLRNLTGDNEDFLMFNINNALALRDNIRESAVEYALFAHVLANLQLDVSNCPGTTSPARFDASKVGLMGHSMGGTLSPIAASAEPLYRALVLSGTGGSFIENVLWKQQPLPIKPALELLLNYIHQDPPRSLVEDDPVLTLIQWAEEPADTLVYTRSIVSEPPAGQSPRPVLMEQGIVDHYIMPPIANAASLSLGLDLAGTPLDATNPELIIDRTPSLESVLPFSGRSQVPLPVTGNRGGVTAVVVQHPADGIEDGHEIVFQTDPPKREYRCFLQTWAAGQTPLVPQPGDVNGPCQ
ncbi:MAG TPA: hypothetical protein VIF15_10015 [Polyangiaceae bacterium]|jgi:hypothetical protein